MLLILLCECEFSKAASSSCLIRVEAPDKIDRSMSPPTTRYDTITTTRPFISVYVSCGRRRAASNPQLLIKDSNPRRLLLRTKSLSWAYSLSAPHIVYQRMTTCSKTIPQRPVDWTAEWRRGEKRPAGIKNRNGAARVFLNQSESSYDPMN